ncbi:alpha/beta fold hydrolase [Mycobacterium sp. SMC-4]|uniref:alpha/beta fold hydrolase n=1 Tax=Mycobacterium sp. SMC-4 TaxID=2857059 RepID=UPI0021B1E57A|nr:alpha/beta hydrolase [Mycobacterium sp. SMC-4]UXA20442.1 alpha/beta hydrolase [Mycobacterium sp. SMC-4]
MATCTPLVVHRGGCAVHGWVHGDQSAPLVVMAHGAGMDHRMFDPQLTPLLDAGYRVLTMDLRGHGSSQPIGQLPLTIDDLADDVLGLADQAAAPRFAIVGQSMGGFVAQRLAAQHPERVAAVIIIGTNCATETLSRWEDWGLRSSVGLIRFWPWGDLRRRSARVTAITPQIRAYAYEAMSALTKADFVEVWKAVAGAIQPEPGHQSKHPLLLTHGDQDRTGTVAKSVANWASREPSARYDVIPDAGHNANQDNPVYFNDLLMTFLEEHYPVGAPE